MSAAPRLSATILLLRDAPGLEVLMVKRNYQIDFASGALVFPGGKISQDDADPRWAERCTGPSEPARIGAIREAFEESGLLLARPRGSDAMAPPEMAEALAPLRADVEQGAQSFFELIAAHDLILACDALVPFSRWITPEVMPKRFDTHFYLAPAPEGQIAEQDGHETTEALWIAPDAALEAAGAGKATVIFPTRMNLGRLALAQSSAAALARFASAPVPEIMPVVGEMEGGAPCLRIPQIEGYGQTEEPLEGAMKALGVMPRAD